MNKIIMISIAIGMLFSTIGTITKAAGVDCGPQMEEDMPAVCMEQTSGPRFRLRR